MAHRAHISIFGGLHVSELNQGHLSDELPLNMAGNESQSAQSQEDLRNQAPADQTVARKATGPRSPQGKNRSKRNAFKHGLFSKAIHFTPETRSEYCALLNGLLESWQPQGKFENVLVEELAVQYWRKRRLLEVESAEIAKTGFSEGDAIFRLQAQLLHYVRQQRNSDGQIDKGNDLAVVREAIDALMNMLTGFLSIDCQDGKYVAFVKRLLVVDHDGKASDQFHRLINEIGRLTMVYSQGKENDQDPKQQDAEVRAALEAEIKRLMGLYNGKIHNELMKVVFDQSVACIPPQEISQHLMRCEVQISREIDRIINRLERAQRIRKGQPPPPQLDVKFS
jgi:hypothetical protein